MCGSRLQHGLRSSNWVHKSMDCHRSLDASPTMTQIFHGSLMSRQTQCSGWRGHRRTFSHSMRRRCWSDVMMGSPSASFLVHSIFSTLTFFGKRSGSASAAARTSAMQHVATLFVFATSSSSSSPVACAQQSLILVLSAQQNACKCDCAACALGLNELCMKVEQQASWHVVAQNISHQSRQASYRVHAFLRAQPLLFRSLLPQKFTWQGGGAACGLARTIGGRLPRHVLLPSLLPPRRLRRLPLLPLLLLLHVRTMMCDRYEKRERR